MEIPVLVEPLGPGKFRATVFHLSAEGATADEAKQRVRDALDALLASGATVTTVSVPTPFQPPASPYPSYAGVLKDHPLLDEWLQVMAENRRQADADPDY